MVEPTVTEQQPQAQSSVEITRYKDGTYGYAIKQYRGSPLPDLTDLYIFDDALKARFVAKPVELADQLEASINARERLSAERSPQ